MRCIVDDNGVFPLFIQTYVVGAQSEAILMNTHNLGFYVELTTIIF